LVINGSSPNWLPVRAAFLKVPYLVLFEFFFINDIVNEINAEIKLFADDTSLYLIVDNPNDTAFLLNQDLNQLQRRSEKWLVKFNPNKIETMVISSKRSAPYHSPLQMNDQDLHEVNSHKHLGVIISDNGQWNDYIDYIVKKTYNRLNIMRKSRTFLDRYSLQNNHIFFIRPLMEYVDVIWDNNSIRCSKNSNCGDQINITRQFV
jgi:hypothetical protein